MRGSPCAGNRVGIITNTGGPSVIATDALVAGGLAIPPLSEDAVGMLNGKLLPEVSLRNPVDVLATANAGHFRAVLDAMMDDEGIDSIFINFVTPFFVDCDSIAREIAEANRKRKKPIVCNLMTDKRERIETIRILKEGNVPCFDFPGAAARALAALTRYGTILRREPGKVRSFEDVDLRKTAAILTGPIRTAGRHSLPTRVRRPRGLRHPRCRLARRLRR